MHSVAQFFIMFLGDYALMLAHLGVCSYGPKHLPIKQNIYPKHLPIIEEIVLNDIMITFTTIQSSGLCFSQDILQ